VLKTAPLSWSELTRRTWREVVDDHVFDLAAQLSYYFFLALFSAILFLLALAGFFPLSNAHTASVAWPDRDGRATQRPLIPLRQRLVPIASCLTVVLPSRCRGRSMGSSVTARSIACDTRVDLVRDWTSL